VTNSETLRCFVAIDLPANLKEQLTSIITAMQAAPAGTLVNWVRPTGLHLTLKFLGEVPLVRRPEIEATLLKVFSNPQVTPFELSAGGLGTFPTSEQPRVIWVGLGGNLAALGVTQKRVEAALAALGFPPEERKFSPHLTLGRLTNVDTATRQTVGQFIRDFPIAAELARFQVQEAVLMRSELHPAGAIYTPLTHFHF
jgi:2'-5' RNA ligase